MFHITDEQRIARYSVLNLTEAEQKDLCEYDKVCEKSSDSPTSKGYITTPYDATQEQRETIKKMKSTGTRAYKFSKRERKENATKAGLIAEIAKFFEENSSFSVEKVEVLNKERQLAFSIGNDRFEVTLIQKRKPKGA